MTKITIVNNEIFIDGVKVAAMTEKESTHSLDFKRIIDGMELFKDEFGREYVTIDEIIYAEPRG